MGVGGSALSSCGCWSCIVQRLWLHLQLHRQTPKPADKPTLINKHRIPHFRIPIPCRCGGDANPESVPHLYYLILTTFKPRALFRVFCHEIHKRLLLFHGRVSRGTSDEKPLEKVRWHEAGRFGESIANYESRTGEARPGAVTYSAPVPDPELRRLSEYVGFPLIAIIIISVIHYPFLF